MDYKASIDLTGKIVTVLVTLLFAYTTYRMVTSINNALLQSKPTFIFYGVIILLLVTYFFSLGLCTWKYRVDEKSLVIVAPLYNKTILKENILKADLVDKKDLGFVIRTFGIGGLFGYYGWHNGSKIGSFFLYGTQMKNLILIEMKKGDKYIITPNDTGLLSTLTTK